ncbi:1-deoxy-D-xylulose-5-phosphate synthase [Microbispora sp. ATCC PTA-5024]|uniref:1-deoxy-D-xylulose-5-phosphate synthase n=1 Tax=Microbispora sp. ATCC PTA-5024 TaxID=316330 RepID=UPI0003DDF026|nr:1-deoxy-D-xylulose-5-phosphate synthase [Microbispora sp. ATCC PTA-5024]ETK32901.1 1-deoxy-D-xylulose-5-phosphate synthase [Microbispora sp. ATCC PTA-5024]
MTLLDDVNEPSDLRRLSHAQLAALAREIRAFLVRHVAKTGGHLGPNLGVVELTLALHRSFDSPRDALLWDVGHQAYVHKIVTGRARRFTELRRRGGLSGYPSRAESPHDHIEHSHASAALSYADGMAKARELSGETDRRVVAVVGDGALTGGLAWEALNSIAAAPHRPVVIVVNDNGRSYAPTVGGLARHLAMLRSGGERLPDEGEQEPGGAGATGRTVRVLFEDLGLTYLGPVDGHDIAALEEALERAKACEAPVVVHCVTRKGLGYRPAEEDDEDHLHGVGVIDPLTGRPPRPGGLSWSAAFGDEMVSLAAERRDLVAITAAMPGSVGLTRFAEAYPARCFDVGIAEQHAVASAAGLAMAGLHPVVALYGTFLNRALDQVLMDLALHRLGATLVVDRAGVTGDDGPSHNGLWDLALLQPVPGLRIAAPRDLPTLREELREAIAVTGAPTAVRFPRGAVGADIPALRRTGGVDVLRESHDGVLVIAVGAMAQAALDASRRCAPHGVETTVVDPRWVKPLPVELIRLVTRHRAVVTVEDGLRTGGVGSSLVQSLHDAGVRAHVQVLGVSEGFPGQGTRAEILAEAGLAAESVAEAVIAAAAATL